MSPAPVKDAPNNLPPDEKFWKRYSPHGEAPLSVAGSFSAHAIAVGGLILFAVYLAALFVKPAHSLPVEPVRLQTGGGGGDPNAKGKGEGGSGPRPAENVGEEQVELPGELQPEARRPDLNPAEKAKVEEKFDQDASRFIQESNSEASKAFARLQDGIRRQLNDGLKQDQGMGGTGSGGGKGSGKGTGVGSGTGEGKMALNKREKRMLRWHMRFTANDGAEYLQQLRGLGAILAFPVGDDEPVFHVVRDLRPGGQAQVEDVRELKRIYWIDDKPKSVMDIMGALRLRLPGTPSRFVAFMPEALEKKLFEMERRYVERVLRRRFDEDAINETNFRCVPAGAGFQPELISVSMR